MDIAFLDMTQLNQETYIYGPNTLSRNPLKVYITFAELMVCTYYVPDDDIYAGIGLYEHLNMLSVDLTANIGHYLLIWPIKIYGMLTMFE